jgi:methylaspartate ammonia-lyase
VNASDLSKGFGGYFHRDTATIRWSAQQEGFTFVSDLGTSSFAELGYVINNLGVATPATVP